MASLVKQSESASPDGPDVPASGTPRPHRHRRGRRRIALVAAGLVLALAAIAAVGVGVLRARYDSAVRQRSLLAAEARHNATRHLTLHGPLNFLLLGSDARPGERLGQRSDTIIVVHVPASLDRAYLISIPRDLRVEIPPEPRDNFSGAEDKINSAFAYGSVSGRTEEAGVQLLSATLTRLTGARFDGAAIVDFGGFQEIVNLLGGVTLCVDTLTRSVHTGTVYRPGCQHMRPWAALDYLRQRYDQPNGDYDRQRHQQQFLKAVLAEATAQAARDPLKLDGFIRAAGHALTVDTNGLPLDQLAFGLRGIRSNALVGIRVPSYPQMIDNVSYVLPYDAADGLYTALREDRLDSWVRANPKWVNRL